MKIGYRRSYDKDWTEIDDSELEWYLNWATHDLKACQAECERRQKLREADMGPAEKAVHEWKRYKAKTAHRDAGGSDEAMIEVNQTADLLLEMLKFYKNQLEAANGKRNR